MERERNIMTNIYFPDEEISTDDLMFICYMIERISRVNFAILSALQMYFTAKIPLLLRNTGFRITTLNAENMMSAMLILTL